MNIWNHQSRREMHSFRQSERRRLSIRHLIVLKRYSTVSFRGKSPVKSSVVWFNLSGIERRMNGTQSVSERQKGEIEKEREIDSSLRAEMIVLGKKQSALIDFLRRLNGGCLSGSHYLPSDLPECLHTSGWTAALLWRRGLTRTNTHTHRHTTHAKHQRRAQTAFLFTFFLIGYLKKKKKETQVVRGAPLIYTHKHRLAYMWRMCMRKKNKKKTWMAK